ncbi:MAG TPA: Rrf2 family transcriptional regulator [Elusimicrobiota bacterium]|nr:Rrf2 family transcriptional regulator [Elusimicrobiota bacterium]
MRNTQFSVAVHVMAGLGARARRGECAPSRMLAESVNTSPSFVRRVLAKLSKAGLIRTSTGKNGFCAVARDPKTITLLDIYRAVDAPKAFAVHEHPARPSCPISCGIKASLQKVLDRTQASLEADLKKTTLDGLVSELTS